MDENDRVCRGPYPGALRDVLGLTVEEWRPLRAGEHVTLTWEEPGLPADATAAGPVTIASRAALAAEPIGTAETWTEAVILAGAKPVAWYADGPAAGGPAVTRYGLGEGHAWYVSARTDAAATAAILAAACACAGLAAPGHQVESGPWPPGVEVVRRTDGQRRFTTLVNHTETPATVQLPQRIVTVQPGDVTVIAE